MVEVFTKAVTGQQVGLWLLIAFLVAYFIYKEWPEFKKRVSKGSVDDKTREQTDKTVEERLSSIESRLAGIEDKLVRDYTRMNHFEVDIQRNKDELDESIEENAIMMRAMLVVLKGLQEIGTNESTRESQKEIEDWLNKKAHKGRN